MAVTCDWTVTVPVTCDCDAGPASWNKYPQPHVAVDNSGEMSGETFVKLLMTGSRTRASGAKGVHKIMLICHIGKSSLVSTLPLPGTTNQGDHLW